MFVMGNGKRKPENDSRAVARAVAFFRCDDDDDGESDGRGKSHEVIKSQGSTDQSSYLFGSHARMRNFVIPILGDSFVLCFCWRGYFSECDDMKVAQ